MTTHVINKDVPFLGVSSAFSYLDLNNDGHPDIRFNGVNKAYFISTICLEVLLNIQ